MSEIRELTAEIVEWADSVFPQRKLDSALLKLFGEVGELIKDPDSPGEYADICIMVFDLAAMHNVDLAQAIRDKMVVNRSRRWAITAVGTLQHIEDKSNVQNDA
jgi:NTP pyrophosphatase (non-canonical NTP hydrolase)